MREAVWLREMSSRCEVPALAKEQNVIHFFEDCNLTSRYEDRPSIPRTKLRSRVAEPMPCGSKAIPC
jgi:hypothetical protein